MLKKTGLILILTAVLISGCATVSYLPSTQQTYAPTTSVDVFWKEPQKPYIELGELVIKGSNCFTSEDELLENLKKEAMKKGADAVIVKAIHPSAIFIYTAAPSIEGMAIKYKEK